MITKKGDILMDNAIYLILLILFVVGMYAFVSQQKSGAGVWEDFYAKEIVKVIDMSKPGDVVKLKVHKATEIAKVNEVASFSGIFQFDNLNNELCVRLNSGGRRTCYSYFNDIDIVDVKLDLGKPVNYLTFRVTAKEENE